MSYEASVQCAPVSFEVRHHGHISSIASSLALLLVCTAAAFSLHAQEGDFGHARDTVVVADSTMLLSATLDQGAKPAINDKLKFNPNPMRAMWLSALCPGAGQIYNRRYWKLPIVIGAFVGLTYGTSWNNRMLNDYSKAYRDITDNDPNTRSYMDFYPPTVKESDLDKTWLTSTLKNRKDYYRRYRDICIIGIAAVYLLNVIDAYVDASMMHFDVSDDLSMRLRPAVIESSISRLPSVGLGCAFSF